MVTIDEAIASYLAGRPAATVAVYRPVLARWAQLLLDTGTPWLEATPALVQQHMDIRRRTGVTPETLRAELSPIRGLYRWAQSQDLTTRNPAETIVSPTVAPRSVQRWLTREQSITLLEASLRAPAPAGLIVHLALLNGLRRGDILTARRNHIRVIDDTPCLWLPHRKNGVMQTVALPDATVNLLPPPTQSGRMVTYSSQWINTRLDRLAEEIGLEHRLRLHQLRATFITLSLDAGVPPRDVMASAGHAHLATTAYYDRAYGSIRRNASGRLADYLGAE